MYLYLEGLKRFQNVDPEDPISWFQIAGKRTHVCCAFSNVLGIHGLPYQRWPTYEKEIKETGSGTGFCTHSSILFLTWHRPYLALFEVCPTPCPNIVSLTSYSRCYTHMCRLLQRALTISIQKRRPTYLRRSSSVSHTGTGQRKTYSPFPRKLLMRLIVDLGDHLPRTPYPGPKEITTRYSKLLCRQSPSKESARTTFDRSR